jgi:hypothetical protein
MFRRMLLVHCQEEFTKDVNALIQAIKVRLQRILYCNITLLLLYVVLTLRDTVSSSIM